MIHPDTEIRFVGEKIGLGVCATRLIRKGTIVWILDDLDIRLSASRAGGGHLSHAPDAGRLPLRPRAMDEMAREAFRSFNLVDQPLRHLIRPEFVERVGEIAAGRAEVDPIVVHPYA